MNDAAVDTVGNELRDPFQSGGSGRHRIGTSRVSLNSGVTAASTKNRLHPPAFTPFLYSLGL